MFNETFLIVNYIVNLLKKLGLSDYKPGRLVRNINSIDFESQDLIIVALDQNWIHIMDNEYCDLSNFHLYESETDYIKELGNEMEVFSCLQHEQDDYFNYRYFNYGKLIRSYSLKRFFIDGKRSEIVKSTGELLECEIQHESKIKNKENIRRISDELKINVSRNNNKCISSFTG